MLTILAKLLTILNSDTQPRYIALAITLAMMAGLSTTLSLVMLLVVVVLFCFRAHLGSFLMFYALFTLVAVLISPVINLIGESVLTSSNLQEVWQGYYQHVWFRYLEYNDTYQMGSTIAALVLAIPVYFIALVLVNAYRDKLMAFINKFKIIRSLKASKFYKIYQAANEG